MTVARIITNIISRIAVAAVTVVTTAALAFGGVPAVGAQAATGTYDCGTYGGGTYDQTDCTDASSSSTDSSSAGGSSSSSSTSTSTGNGASTSTSTTDTIVLNDYSEYTASTGKSLTFTTGDVFYFNLGGEKHTITVKSIDASRLILTIASTPTDVTIPIGQTVNYDVDKDGTPDIAITYSSVSADGATATAIFRALTSNTATSGLSSTGSTSDSSTGGTAASPSAPNLWWLWIIPIVIGLALLFWAIAAARRRKAAHTNGGDGTTFN